MVITLELPTCRYWVKYSFDQVFLRRFIQAHDLIPRFHNLAVAIVQTTIIYWWLSPESCAPLSSSAWTASIRPSKTVISRGSRSIPGKVIVKG